MKKHDVKSASQVQLLKALLEVKETNYNNIKSKRFFQKNHTLKYFKY